MLVICKRASCASMRPKYQPLNSYPMWVVINSNTGETLLEPTSRDTCQKFIDKNWFIDRAKDRREIG